MISSTKKPPQYLVVSILGVEKPYLLHDLCKLATSTGCTIIDSDVATYGYNFGGTMMFAGTWNALAKLENNLTAFEQKNEIRIVFQRTEVRKIIADILPYVVYLTTLESVGIISKITQYFVDHKINIHDFKVLSYTAPFSEQNMLSITLMIAISNSKLLAEFRESFMLFCDDQNFDVAIEPQKSLI